jgi:hypothetical protein
MRLRVQRVALIESFKETNGRLGCELAACDSPQDDANVVSALWQVVANPVSNLQPQTVSVDGLTPFSLLT